MIANDKSQRVNKSLFTFLKMFDELNNFTSVSINLGDKGDNGFSKYMEIVGKTLNTLELKGNPLNIITEKSKKFDILIIGNIKHSMLLERFTGNIGLKLLENIDIPIYIGI